MPVLKWIGAYFNLVFDNKSSQNTQSFYSPIFPVLPDDSYQYLSNSDVLRYQKRKALSIFKKNPHTQLEEYGDY